jgi:hypothetical protein
VVSSRFPFFMALFWAYLYVQVRYGTERGDPYA